VSEPARRRSRRPDRSRRSRRLTRLRRPWTLRTRLIVALLVLSAGGLAVMGAVSVVLLRHSLQVRVDQQLALAGQPWANGAAPPKRVDADRPAVPTDYRIAVFDARGRPEIVLGRPPGGTGGPMLPTLNPRSPAATDGRPFTVPDTGGGSSWRVLVVSTPDDHNVAVALSMANTDAAVHHLLVIELMVGAVVLGVLGVAGILAIRLGLRPLRRIEQTAGAIARGELDRRVPDVDDRTETGRVGAALNTMLARVASALRQREESQDRLRRFVADASHELRTPLTSIRGFAELYRQGGAPETSDVDRLMRRIEDEATRMGQLVEDLLLLARMDEQRPLSLSDVDLLVLAADAVHDARARDPERPVTLATPAGPQHVLGDEYQLRAVITNLVSNALTHTPAGTPVRVTVDRQRDGRPNRTPIAAAGEQSVGARPVLIEVADAGPGLSAEQAPRVFDRFYRTEEAHARHRGGSGLGLAITASIVAAHRGRIELFSEPGAGARFRVLLPVG
jgi:two-component system OmpR family sensor kinase